MTRLTAHWQPGTDEPAFTGAAIAARVGDFRRDHVVIRHPQAMALGVGTGGETVWLNGEAEGRTDVFPIVAALPPIFPEWLGEPSFAATHGVRFAYVGGEMARGIASVEMAVKLAHTGALGFLGAAGMSFERLERDLVRLNEALGPRRLPWGANLIHTPAAAEQEERTVDIFLRHGVRRMSTSAFMGLAPSIVRYACQGLHRDEQGRVQRTHHVFAKISRPEVARPFLLPPPAALLASLQAAGKITALEAELAAGLPVAEDITVEADSGGHTDNRPLTALFPTILQLKEEIAAQHGYARQIRIGAAGGLGTPAAVAAAFALGAAYVLVGSVNQSAMESGLAADARQMLAEADLADVAMTAAADMFEAGVKVQVLKRGTLMAARGNRLYQIYRSHASLEAIAAGERAELERTIFRAPLEKIWEDTAAFFTERAPHEVTRAQQDPKHRMALVFRWYLGQSSRWPMSGETDRRADYQVWCGPAMGAFNAWVKGSFLEPVQNRTVDQIALNLLEGAAIVTRAHQLRTFGVPVPASAFGYRPQPLSVEDHA